MIKRIGGISLLVLSALCVFSCSKSPVMDPSVDVSKVHVDHISPEMEKVRDYVPKNAVIAHRGSTFWTPEETEAAYRWAREMGADYLEADLQVTKDGVILALHDDNLRRTTNIETVYGDRIPASRYQYYLDRGMSPKAAAKQFKDDEKDFQPYRTAFYTYSELAKLDAGTWFNQTNMEEARTAFSTQHQYISTLEDLIKYAEGKRLKRNENGERVFHILPSTSTDTVKTLSGKTAVANYKFEYEDDPQFTGNRPGIYIEFKESWLNPKDIEQRVYNELKTLGWNIIEKPEPATNPFYINGKVNVGRTNGKVILQSFSFSSLVRVADQFKGKIPMCFLLWKGTGSTDMSNVTPLGYAAFINLAVKYKAHIIGPSIAGAPNNYDDLCAPWMSYLIRKAGMLNHAYSFDTMDQIKKYMGTYNYKVHDKLLFTPPYVDGQFTNHTELSLQYMIDHGLRGPGAATTVPDPVKLLERLGYNK